MSAVAAPRRVGEPEPAAAARTRADRLLGVLPLLTVFFWLYLLYAWEAWGHVAPWLFGDELELTQLSRAIAATGHAARRGEPHSFNTLYTFLTAPAWWIKDTHTAYAVLKYLGVGLMTSVLFPAYALARLLVSPRLALLAATATAGIPALVYASLILEEPLAYTYSTLCLFLIVKALVARTRWWVVGTLAATAAAPLVRGQLVVIPATFAVAAAILWWLGPRGRAYRAGWSRWDWVGGVTLFVGAVILVNAWIGHRTQSWGVATGYYKQRMLEYGLWAGGALTIGLGVLPVVAGLAGLAGRRRSETERVFALVAAVAIAAFGFYTAVKAAFISTVFSTLVEERNLIYVAPILFISTAVFVERRRRLHPLALAASAALVLYMLWTTPYKMEFHFYADAPGLSILQSANRNLALTPQHARWVLLAVLAISVVVCLLPRLLRGPALAVALGCAGALVLAWTFTGQVTAARSANLFAADLTANLPRPYDWIDRATKGKPAVFLGQQITDPNGIWLLEFWNRSLHYVWSTDGTAPGPGPTVTPDVVKPNGTLRHVVDVPYAVTDQGVEVVGEEVASQPHLVGGSAAYWRLIRISPPFRLRSNVYGIYSDGWSRADTGYARYSTPGNRAGYAVVDVSREGWTGPSAPGNVTVRLGPLRLDENHQPQIRRVTWETRFPIDRLERHPLVIPTPRPPWKVEVNVDPPFSPSVAAPGNTDARELGAEVSYAYSPTRPVAPGVETGPTGVADDGWMGADSAYNQVAPLPGQREAVLTLSRTAWGGPDVPGHVSVRIGRLRVVDGKPALGEVSAERTLTIHRKQLKTITLPLPSAPFRVEVHIAPTFVPAELDPRSPETRHFGAQVGYGFR